MAGARPAAEATQSAALPMQQSAGLAVTPQADAPQSTPPAPTQSSAFWPAQAAASIARDGLQAIGFRTHKPR